jgi:DNA-damage-inducible protein J
MSTVTVRVDQKTKETAAKIFDELGLDVSTAVRMFLKQTANRGELPMDLRQQDPFYGEANLDELRRRAQALDEGKVIVKTLDELRAYE